MSSSAGPTLEAIAAGAAQPMSIDKGFRDDINFLRAFAVVVVVLFHFKVMGFGGGFLGVDIFFVISGFLMTQIVVGRLQQGRFNYIDFLAARAVRIIPALSGLVAVLLLLGAVFMAPLDLERLGKEAWAAMLFHSNVHYRDGAGYFVSELDERWLLHTWSLSVEWQFYMAYPIGLAAVWWLAARGKTAAQAQRNALLAVTLSVVVLVLVSLALCVWKSETQTVRAFFGLPFRAWEMACGGLVYLATPRLAGRQGKWQSHTQLAALLSLVVILLMAAKLNWEGTWPGIYAAVPVLATVVFLLAGCGPCAPKPAWLRMPWVQALGRWSYSIYLWHWPLVVLLHFVYPDGEAPRLASLAALVGSVALGAASYWLIEQRVRFVPHAPGRWRALAVLGWLVVLAGTAKAAVASEGWIARAGDKTAFFRAGKAMAAKDFYPRECANYQLDREALRTCTINAHVSGPGVLVYGDSHAEHLYPWFAAHAKARVDFLTSGGCPPVPGFNRIARGYRCDGFVAEALSRAASGRYGVVVVAGNWNGGIDTAISPLCRAGSGHCRAPADRAELVEANRVAWATLLMAGVTVVVMDQNPYAPFDVLQVNMRRQFLGLAPTGSFTPVQPLGGQGFRFGPEVVSALSEFPNVHLVSLRKELCVEQRCNTIDAANGLPIFVDSNHFSAAWVTAHGTALKAFVP